MPNRRKKKPSRQATLKEFVTVAFAEDMELAQEYKRLLNEGDIPAAIKTQPAQADAAGGFPGIAVMVPEDYLDEAHVLIESQGAYSDFYDMVFDDRDDFGDDDYEDEF